MFQPRLLDGRVAIVTGGGTGLGKATALELVRCGAAVVIAGRRAEVLEAACAEIGQAAWGGQAAGGGQGTEGGDQAVEIGQGVEGGQGAEGGDHAGRVDWLACDVRERGDGERLVEAALNRYGRLDVLVNNAGGQYFTPAELIAAKGWRAVWRLNVDGVLNMAEAAYELAMRAGGGGTIVNVTLSPHHGMPGMAHSGSARATVEALTREMSARWADAGVAVMAVAAGVFDTEVMEKYPQAVRAGSAGSVPLQRMGRVAEHAWLVMLLASPLGRAFNGSTVTLDGARDNWPGPWPPSGLADASGSVPSEARR